MDYNISPSNLFTFNFSDYLQTTQGFYNTANWEQMSTKNTTPGKVFIGRYQHIFSPTTINEFNIGYSFRPENFAASTEEELQRNGRDAAGFAAGQLYPEVNPRQSLPNATFGGVSQPATLAVWGRYPLPGQDHFSTLSTVSLTDNLTKTINAHTLKAGIYADRYWTANLNLTNYNGSYNFGTSTTNPLDTGYAYGNAITGVYQTYAEISARPNPELTTSNIEWFVQDNWKVTRRLTLDYGMRFCWVEPIDQTEGLVPGFDPAGSIRKNNRG